MRRIAATACLAALSVAALAGCNEDKDKPKTEVAAEPALDAKVYQEKMDRLFPRMRPESVSYTECWETVGVRNAALMQAQDRADTISVELDPPPTMNQNSEPHEWVPLVKVEAATAEESKGTNTDLCFTVKYGTPPAAPTTTEAPR